LVDQPESWTNYSYFIDIIQIRLAPKLLNFDEIRRLYLNEGQSAAEIARRYGTVKSVILSILHRMGVRLGSGARALNDPQNYRAKNPPYGYKVEGKKLIINKSELRVCHTIVEMIGRRSFSITKTSKELVRKNFKNRAGNALWDHKTVKTIYERWKDKI
jgi:transposase-like protein